MTALELKEKITVDDVIKICCFLQETEEYYYDAEGHPIFSTFLDHPNEGPSWSWKLYYYPETKLFHVYTRGESYDLIELVRRAKSFETFGEAFRFIIKFFKFKESDREEEQVELTDD